MPFGDPKIGVIDGLGYTWCLKCTDCARTEKTTDVLKVTGSDTRLPYSPQLSDDDRCDGCNIRMLDQDVPRSVPLRWDWSARRWIAADLRWDERARKWIASEA